MSEKSMSQKGKENEKNSKNVPAADRCPHPCGKSGTDKCKRYPAFKSRKSDPNGSYTGRPDDTGEVPVQDADDL